MILALLLGCAKPAPPVELPDSADGEAEAAVAAQPPAEVLRAGLGAEAGDVQALAVEALLAAPLPCDAPGVMCGFAPALALAHRDDDRVREAVIRGLAAHPASPEAGELLRAIARGTTGANTRVRGYAALALAARPDEASRAEVRELAEAAHAQGAALGLLGAGLRVGAPSAAARIAAAFRTSTLPIEPVFFAALTDPGLPWREALAVTEPLGRPALACGMLVAGAPGALGTATRLLHDPDADLRDDTARALAACPADRVDTALASSSRVEARLARVARGTLGPDVATPWLQGDRWADAVWALTQHPDPAAHAPLAAFARGASEAQRETLAVALSRNPLPVDRPLLDTLATDPALRTRVAAAAALHRLDQK